MRALAITVSFAVGLLSLSQEIVWVRIVALGQQARPQAFSLVLAVFLIGIALGAAFGRRLCQRCASDGPRLLRQGAALLLGAAALDLLALWLCAAGLAATQGSSALLSALLLLCGACAAAKGTLFPIVHHLGTVAEAGRVGRSVSRVYLANVLGATLGPVLTGFVLMDRLGLEQVFALVALVTAALGGLALWWAGRASPGSRIGAGQHMSTVSTLALLALAGLALVEPPAVARRIAGEVVGDDGRSNLRHLIQNRHGVIHVLAEDRPGSGDITFGGNAYDGRVSTDLRINANGLDRAYAVATLHPMPRRVLVVGLSTGAWTAVILGLPGVERVDVVEINPGYLELIGSYPQVAPLLRDPRVQVHVDDGRRWLRAHPQARYDLVFQNTTWHWRANSSLLLSRDYLQQLRGHLAPGGMVAINTTGSADVFHTAAQVFTHVGRRKNFAYLSDAPLQLRPDAESVLRAARLWQQPAFDEAAFAPGGLAHELSRQPLQPATEFVQLAAQQRPPRIITDVSPVNEYRHGSAPPWEALGWLLPAGSGPWQASPPPARPASSAPG